MVKLGKGGNKYKWSADGTKFIAASIGTGTGAITYRLDAETGAVVDSTLDFLGTPGLSGDALLGVSRKDSTTVCVYEVPSGSTSPHEFICYPDERSDPSAYVSLDGYAYVSLDGRKLIVASRDGKEGLFTLVDLDTRTARPLADDPSYTESFRLSEIEWLPDASGVLARRQGTIVRLPLAGGPPVPQLVRFNEVNSIGWIALHPAGDRIVINSSRKSPDDDDHEPKDLYIVAGAVDRLGKQN